MIEVSWLGMFLLVLVFSLFSYFVGCRIGVLTERDNHKLTIGQKLSNLNKMIKLYNKFIPKEKKLFKKAIKISEKRVTATEIRMREKEAEKTSEFEYEIRKGTDLNWGIYSTEYNIRIATFSPNAEAARKQIEEAIQIARWGKSGK